MSVTAESLPPPRQQSITPLLIVAVGGALTGFSGIFVRLSETGPVAAGAWRLAIAAIALAPLMRFIGDGETSARGRISPLLFLAGLFFAIDMGLYNWSLSFTSIAHATLIVNLAPVIALTAGVFLFGERLGAAKIGGLTIAIGGAAAMTFARADSAGGTLLGNGMAAAAMIGYALYLVAVKRARREHDTYSIMLWSSVSAAAVMFAAAILLGERLLPAGPSGWAALIALGLISHVLGQGLVAFGMRESPVGLASILLLTQPIVAALLAWAVFGESMGVFEAAGACLVLAGLAMASRARG
jgi:drug/metabolite transporter (DMT)-like permease